MSNVSVILCVPYLIKYNCYSNIDTVTEPMQCNNSTSMLVVNTNKFGAFKRVEEENESQRVSVKMVDNNIYNVEFVDNVQQNQMIGDTPNYCIPLMINAITVQGISYSDPYFSSFNLNYKMAFGAPEYMNKSDYAFKSSVCIIRDEPCMDKTQLLNEKSAHDMICKTKTRMITYDDKSVRTCHDNKVLDADKNESAQKTPVLKTFANGDLTFDTMIELLRKQDEIIKDLKSEEVDSWGVPRRFRLHGGGESSLNAASGWGSPPASNNAGNWGGNTSGQTNNGTNNTQQWNNTQRPPTSQADMNSNKGNGNQMPPTSAASQNWQSSPPNMPNSQPNNNGAPASNGTNNTANGNNGGNNPSNPTTNSNGPTAANGNNGNNTNSTSSAKIEQLNSMREALFSQDGWGGQHVNQDTNWDVPGSPEPGSKVEPAAGGPPAWKPNVNNGAFLGTDLWEANLRNGGQPPPQPASKTPWGHTPTTNIGGTWGEDDDAADSANVWTGPPPPQQWPAGPPQHTQQWGTMPKKDDWNAWGEPHRPSDPRLDPHRSQDPRQNASDPRHDLRGGISGRLNGDMWNQHHHTGGPSKMMPSGGVNQWGSQGPKDPIKSSGWEEPSPPAARRAAGGFDDGTSLWAQRGMAGMSRGAPQGPPAQARIPPTPTKPDAVWGAHAQRNGSWEEPHTPGWPEREVPPSWADASGPGLWPVPKPKPTGPAGWPEDIGEWGGPKPPQGGPLGKQLPKEMVWNSKQFRYLVEMGYKKEEAEAALRSRDMNAEEALEMLNAARGDGWRRDEHFNHGHFQPQQSVPSVSPAVVQKLLNQPPPPTVQHHPSYNPNSGTGGSGQPSTAQLRMLVQQIQMAVSAGYLNHQILNQPLAPQTLVLLNQLLQQIKVLQQLVQQHTLSISKSNSSLALQYSVQITKSKQQITALQTQIATQQAIYMKQQTSSADLFKPNHDPLIHITSNFGDMSIKEPQSGYGGSGQSRLNQWKLPSLEKDSEGSEFCRAPGTAKSATSPPQLNQMGLQPDSTWGVGRGAEGWGEGGADVADGKDPWPSHPTHQPVFDLVPEFEPGKPWKGNQMKNVEDDPAMTPGSVVRPTLSLAVIKDTDMLGGKTSPPGNERSLSSSTWSYAPPASAAGLKPQDAWAKSRPAPPGLKWPQHQVNARAVSWQTSTWLLLKNLTAQIDGSTLKTLCLQHGPLQNFHLYLNQGLALARYSTREEAAKAQTALNNCVLSNTTIFAESPAESEVQMILQHLGSGSGGVWRSSTAPSSGKDAWGGFAGLWPDQHDQRATPSSLNSFLPPDLLGGESI